MIDDVYILFLLSATRVQLNKLERYKTISMPKRFYKNHEQLKSFIKCRMVWQLRHDTLYHHSTTNEKHLMVRKRKISKKKIPSHTQNVKKNGLLKRPDKLIERERERERETNPTE